MRLGSIIINGFERVSFTLLREFEIVKESGDRMGAARMIVLYNPADSGMLIEPGQQIDIYRAADEESSSASVLFGSTTAIFGEPLFGEATIAEKIFSGNIVNVEPQVMVAQRNAEGEAALWGEVQFGTPLFGEAPGTERVNCVRLEARDNNYILESTIVSGTFTAQTDLAIITSLFAAAPTINIVDVASTATISSLVITDETLRSALQKITERTGAIYYIDSDLEFHYFLPTARPAAFSLGESYDLLTSFPFERQTFRFTKEWRSPANRVKVVGKVGSGGVAITRTRNDTTSQGLYGIKAITVVDRQIATNGEADARGDVELANRANPQYGGTLVTYVDGLEVGEYLPIDATETLGLAGSYTIRRISMRWLNKQTTRYEIEWGAYQPDIARTLRALYDATKTPSAVLPTTPAPATVTGGSGGSIVTGTIEQVNMANLSIGTAQIQNLAVTNAKINDLSADKIQTGNLEVGGSGHVGQITIRDSSNGAFGWIGKNGSDYGGWFETLWVGGSGPSTAKLRCVAGNISAVFDDNDSFRLTSTVNARLVIIENTGVIVRASAASSDYTQNTQQQYLITNSSSATAAMSLSGGTSTFSAIGSGGSVPVQMISTGSGATSGLFHGGSKVTGARITGWNPPTGTAVKGSYATSTATVTQVAEALKALIDDLVTHGLIG